MLSNLYIKSQVFLTTYDNFMYIDVINHNKFLLGNYSLSPSIFGYAIKWFFLFQVLFCTKYKNIFL